MKLSLTDRFEILRASRSHRIRRLPILVLSPHSRCNCRCVMCDIWRANAHGRELTQRYLERQLAALERLRPKWIVLSGGEPLMHRNLFRLCALLRSLGARITLLSTGLLLEKFAASVVEHVDDVIVSLDGSAALHDEIRNTPRAFERLEAGVRQLRTLAPEYPVSARCVIQRANFRDLPNIVATARELELTSISFLAADVTSNAFNRPDGWTDARADTVALGLDEARELEALIESHSAILAREHAAGFVAESLPKLKRIAAYYAAHRGDADFPAVRCNAPWVSAVVEADGQVRPCFFLPAYGSSSEADLDGVLNSESALGFRRQLNVATNQTCRRCVCSLKL